MYKFKLKENNKETLQPKDVDPNFIDRISKLYGKVDMENDFFDSELETYFKTDEIDDTTGSVSHILIKLASFDKIFDSLEKAADSSEILLNNKTYSSDSELKAILQGIDDIFNKFRTHLRKSYPDQYKMVQNTSISEESTTTGTPGPSTPYMFKKKDLNEAQFSNFQKGRIDDFDRIGDEMNDIYKRLSNAKNKTITHYNNNPGDDQVLYPTELLHDYFEDIKLLLKQEDQ